ncbi:hypothetical protein GOP47_0011844 [Adiantum capillus-veneris]|uniref:Kinesin-like protein n=1 Tax=Adiantum capillus-veneris TaxID=13818 RepID=A0A9D4USK0_ADICA|nr:hypothetical protein GOP47_0011065 [Adiantum capillus-veneris]KAI5073831.1 hypothetical protein GOP47_0011844 [Adiantum capillus-veneris]
MMRSAAVQPRTPSSSTKSPFNKENKEAVSEGKPMTGRDIFGARVMSEPRVRVRHALSSVNASRQERCSIGGVSTPSTGIKGYDAVTPSSMTKEDVEELLSLKMKGKGKFDFKGKSEQMMEYIRKLRACIRTLQLSEETLIREKEETCNQLLEECKTHRTTEEQLKNEKAEVEKNLLDKKSVCKILEDELYEAELERKSLLAEQEKTTEVLQEANSEVAGLLEDLEAYRKDLESANEQVIALQEINKRLQEYNASLQMYNSKMQTDAATAAETISKIQKEKSAMMETLSSLKGHSVALQEQLNQAKESMLEGATHRKLLMDEQEKLRIELLHALETEKQQIAQLGAMSAELDAYKECTRKSAIELEDLRAKSVLLEGENAAQVKELTGLREQIILANAKLQMAESTVVQHQHEGAEQKAIMEDLQQQLSEAEQRIREGDILRRKLHNTILELKGNVRVFCRVRPLLPEDESSVLEEQPVLQYPNSAELLGRGIELVQSQGQKHEFTFDKVFGPEVGQQDVFVEISQLVQSALDGYKVCIFAYGQTGSGKTYTMLGNPDDLEQKGVIPRSLEQIFESSQVLSSQGWTFQIQASMLEIYNETIRDLLAPGSKNGTPSKQFSVKHDQNGSTSVSDLTVIEVTKWKEVSSLLRQAAQSRAVAKTAINEQSSRSHCVFTLRISGYNQGIDQQVSGVLNLIDLAGSERLSRTGSVGDRLKETQAINKSLASLGDVILAIANRDQHIPYRNSKLTYLLQPCLGGDSKTLMFVNVSPDARSANESLCSLRFAAKVNACDIGVPRRNTHMLWGSQYAGSREDATSVC